jgi:hypothetical protein
VRDNRAKASATSRGSSATIAGTGLKLDQVPTSRDELEGRLHSPEISPDFHDSAITYLREALQASLPAPYFAALRRRVWIEGLRRSVGPDVQIQRSRAGITVPQPAGGIAVDPVVPSLDADQAGWARKRVAAWTHAE